MNIQINRMEQQLNEKHEHEWKEINGHGGHGDGDDVKDQVNLLINKTKNISISEDENGKITDDEVDEEVEGERNNSFYIQHKVSKAQRRRERKSEKEKIKQEQIHRELLSTTNVKKDGEDKKLKTILQTKGLQVHDIPSDGDCMYKAIEHQLQLQGVQVLVNELRQKTCSYMKDHRDSFKPFLVNEKSGHLYTDDEFEEYCDSISKTKAWGGHTELKALSHILQKPIEVVQADGPTEVLGGLEYENQPILLR